MDDGGRRKPDRSRGNPEEIMEGIYRVEIPLPDNPLKAVNSYVIKGRERNLIIDTGMRRQACLDAMRAGLERLRISLPDTDFFITHFHADHLGLVSDLATETTEIYLNGPDAARILAGGFSESFENSARLHGFPDHELREALDRHPARLYGPRLPLRFTQTYDGQTIRAGGYNFRCVETPGHSFGHTCLYDAEDRMLISGDHILADITPNIQGWFDNWNPLQEYLKSLESTALLDVTLVLPGHRRVLHDMRGRIEELKRHHEKRAEEALHVLKTGPKTAYQVASEMTWDIACDSFDLYPLSQRWFALGETIGHLIYLEVLSKVRREITEERGRTLVLWRPGRSLSGH
jgi:glyoxylase-like metal-dependent hydrolase (beta-lactamase superfamily II)